MKNPLLLSCFLIWVFWLFSCVFTSKWDSLPFYLFWYSNPRGSKKFWCILSRQNWQDSCRAPRPYTLKIVFLCTEEKQRTWALFPWLPQNSKWLSLLLSHTVVPLTIVLLWIYMYSFIHILSLCICVYIFKEKVHYKKLELNLLCQYDILLAADILFMDLSYGCYGNKTAVSGPFCGAAQRRRCPPCAAPPASPCPLSP